MAPISSEPHTIVQSWVPVELAQELKARGRAEGRSVSSLVRDALVDQLRQNTGEGPVPAGSVAPPGAGTESSEARDA